MTVEDALKQLESCVADRVLDRMRPAFTAAIDACPGVDGQYIQNEPDLQKILTHFYEAGRHSRAGDNVEQAA